MPNLVCFEQNCRFIQNSHVKAETSRETTTLCWYKQVIEGPLLSKWELRAAQLELEMLRQGGELAGVGQPEEVRRDEVCWLRMSVGNDDKGNESDSSSSSSEEDSCDEDEDAAKSSANSRRSSRAELRAERARRLKGEKPRGGLARAVNVLRAAAAVLQEHEPTRALAVPRNCMAACYGPDGAHYVAHRDNCGNTLSDRRYLTLILYLNDPGVTWSPTAHTLPSISICCERSSQTVPLLTRARFPGAQSGRWREMAERCAVTWVPTRRTKQATARERSLTSAREVGHLCSSGAGCYYTRSCRRGGDAGRCLSGSKRTAPLRAMMAMCRAACCCTRPPPLPVRYLPCFPVRHSCSGPSQCCLFTAAPNKPTLTLPCAISRQANAWGRDSRGGGRGGTGCA
jgi:hypothetical protein